jgi:hypothetical protein
MPGLTSNAPSNLGTPVFIVPCQAPAEVVPILILIFKVNIRRYAAEERLPTVRGAGGPSAWWASGLCLWFFAPLLWPATAGADRRSYGETYEAVTAPKGELDVETWGTYAGDGELLNGPASKGYRGMLELEYGLTDRWDIAIYNMLDLPSDSSTGERGYAGFKIESRYRLLLPGEWFVDPVLYLEYARLFVGDSQQKWEIKLILGKDIGPWNLSWNLAAEVERLRSGDYIPETEYDFGVSREILGPSLKLGIEAFGKAEKPPGGSIQAFLWAGPALSWATTFRNGPMRGLWVTAAGGRGLTTESQEYYGRLILSFQF